MISKFYFPESYKAEEVTKRKLRFSKSEEHVWYDSHPLENKVSWRE